MTMRFSVHVDSHEVLEQVDGAWQPADFARMLDDMDYGDTTGLSDDELREMCLLSLQEREPDEAAEVVLRCRFGDRLRDGQIRNCAQEMLDEKLWEQYADMAYHEDFFHAGSLLWQAFPRDFPTPDAVEATLTIAPTDTAAAQILIKNMDEEFVVRVLSDGMDERSVLHRLFSEQLAGEPFPESESILWSYDASHEEEDLVRLSVLSSGYWLDALQHVKSYDSNFSPARISATVAE